MPPGLPWNPWTLCPQCAKSPVDPENFLILLIKLQKGTSGGVLGHHLLICDGKVKLLLCHRGNQQWQLHPSSLLSLPGMLQRGVGVFSGNSRVLPSCLMGKRSSTPCSKCSIHEYVTVLKVLKARLDWAWNN